MKRYTKNFKRKTEKMFNSFELDEYYLFMLCLRKELLSDILEYENYVSNKIICSFKFTSYNLRNLQNNLENKKKANRK